MVSKFDIKPVKLDKWIVMEPEPVDPGVISRCDLDFVRSALAGVDGVEVVSVEVNTSGEWSAPETPFEIPEESILPPTPVWRDLPDFCAVVVRHANPGGSQDEITVWVPLSWNGRFLGLGGSGNRTEPTWWMYEPDRTILPPVAIRNGFATAWTDAGIRDPRATEWAFKGETNELDWELLRNWAHRSTHQAAVIGKTVTTAIHGTAPEFSYFQGCSGGGRQALSEAQRYPEDYDGIWSAEPAINWTRFILSNAWPALVMKERGNPLPHAKLEAFRTAALEANPRPDGLRDDYTSYFDRPSFSATNIVGTDTDAGPITELDAQVMQEIWDGPKDRYGRSYGTHLIPGVRSWRDAYKGELFSSFEIDGELVPYPFHLATTWLRYVREEANYGWDEVTFDSFEADFNTSVVKFAEFGTDDPDLSAFRTAGAKLILTHGMEDEDIPVQGTTEYYDRVIQTSGGLESAREYIRMFITGGDIHGSCRGPGPGVSAAEGMAALMNWVEHSIAPEEILAQRYSPEAETVDATRPVYAFPNIPRWTGGDPLDACNFRAESIPTT